MTVVAAGLAVGADPASAGTYAGEAVETTDKKKHHSATKVPRDASADCANVYAFVSPDAPSTVTLIANYVPQQEPAHGPLFYEFADDVLYAINIDNTGDGKPDIAYHFRFTTVINKPRSIFYANAPVTHLTKPGAGSRLSRQQTYSLTRVRFHRSGKTTSTVLGHGLLVPPNNVGPRSTPDYEDTFLPSSGSSAVHTVNSHGFTGKVFAGQRADAFFMDVGSLFDLFTMRPFQNLHAIPTPADPGVNALGASNVLTLALQIPIKALASGGHTPTDPMSPHSVIGVWSSSSRRRVRTVGAGKNGRDTVSGAWEQLSRRGNPLVDEFFIGVGDKDHRQVTTPTADATTFFHYVADPELGAALNVLYPNVFPQLAAYTHDHHGTSRSKPGRPDLVAMLLSGLPAGIVTGLRTRGGSGVADILRLNLAIRPTSDPSPYGALSGDLAGYPNGRRLSDDVTTIMLRAVAGYFLPRFVSGFSADDAAAVIEDGTTGPATRETFPYLGTPYSGYETPSS